MIEYNVKVFENGIRIWYLNGNLHREDGPAVEYPDGGKTWWINGKPHRENGPAIEWYGSRYWYKNGKLHRKDGPAIEDANGEKHWYLNGIEYTEEKFLAKTKKPCSGKIGKIVEIDGVKYQLTLVAEVK
jgi:hypothetical protein